MTNAPPKLDAATLRRIAVEASVDPRTVTKRLRGEDVRGLAKYRIDAALARYYEEQANV